MNSAVNKYSQALKETTKYLNPPVGFSNYETPKEDSNIIIRQNNTILQLLIQIIKKLEVCQENKELVLTSSGITSSSKAINSEKWSYLKVSPEETEVSN